MSASIEFQHYVLVTPPIGQFDRPWFLGFAECGESNVTDLKGRIARATQFRFFGDAESFMQRVVEASADCESGLLRLNGRDTKPEGYIRKWRQTIKDAIPLTAYLHQHPLGQLDIAFRSIRESLKQERQALECKHAGDSLQERIRRIDDRLHRFTSDTAIREFQPYPDIRVTNVTLTVENWPEVLTLLVDNMPRPIRTWGRNSFNPAVFHETHKAVSMDVAGPRQSDPHQQA